MEALNSVKCRGLVIISDKRGFEIFRRGLMLGGVTGKPAATGEILRLISRKSKACECDF